MQATNPLLFTDLPAWHVLKACSEGIKHFLLVFHFEEALKVRHYLAQLLPLRGLGVLYLISGLVTDLFLSNKIGLVLLYRFDWLVV